MITATPLLSVKSVKKSFGEVKALKDINFNLHAGRFMLFVEVMVQAKVLL